jgi:hypothetical protein
MKTVSPNFKYLDSRYSTVTVNHNFRTQYHYNAIDYRGGMGNLVVVGGSDYESLYGNLELTPEKERLRTVLYARVNINKCF